MALNELFTEIANSIRAKNNTTEKIIASDFPKEIEKIEFPLQEKTVMPSEQVQEVMPDKGVYGLSKVSVGRVAMQEKEVTPSTEIQNILPDEGYVGLSKVNVAGVSTGQITDAQYLFYNNCRKDEIADVVKCCKNVTSCERMFYSSSLLQNANLRDFDMSQVTTTWYMFYNCNALRNIYFDKEIKDKLEIVGYMFSGCKSLQSIDLSSFDFSNVIDLRNMFNTCSAVTSIKSFTNLGKGFAAKISAYANYTFNISPCTKITYESLIDLLTNGLYDLNLTYDVANGGTLYAQTLQLGSTNVAKLTADEIAIATAKRLDGKLERRENMQVITHTKPRMLIADAGKHIRAINDVYEPAHIDEEGNQVEEHFPYYSDFVFLADGVDTTKINEMYIEESK